MKNKTAVELLIKQLKNKCWYDEDGFEHISISAVLNEFQQALEMEKQQIIQAYNSGQQIPPFDYAEQYYSETFKKP